MANDYQKEYLRFSHPTKENVMKITLTIVLILISSSLLAFKQLDLAPHLKGTCSPDQMFCAYFSPQDLPVEAVRAYLKSATTSIRIATYNMSIFDYADILNQKAIDGVKIEYMVDFKLSFENKTWPRLINHPNITKHRLPVLRGGNPQMHNKLIIIDNEVLLTGSANYSYMGLIANYENVMAIYYPDVIKKFNDEIDELKSISQIVCNLFSSDHTCTSNQIKDYDDVMYQYITKGTVNPSAINPALGECSKLINNSHKERIPLLNPILQPEIKNVENCFVNSDFSKKLKKLIDEISLVEKYVNGIATKDQPNYLEQDSHQEGKYRVYFSPEDNPESQIINALNETLGRPVESFVYVSANFITNHRIAQTLSNLHKQGVRLRIFFDKGRFVDPMFQSQLKNLLPLGFFGEPSAIEETLLKLGLKNPNPAGSFFNLVTMFENNLTGAWGCNHNKMAIVGTPQGLTLINGSANWSGGAMKINDENLFIIKDMVAITIYLREFVSQLFVYRYGQNPNLKEFKDEIFYLSKYAPCLKTLLGIETGCLVEGKTWNPDIKSTAVITYADIPASTHDPVYLYVKQLDELTNGKYHSMKMYTHENFQGKWVTTIPAPLNWEMFFHAYIDGQERSSNDYTLQVAPLGVHVLTGNYRW